MLCKTGSQLAPCNCSYTYADLLFIQVCSEPAPVHCSTAQGKMISPVFSAALHNRLTACFCHCIYTYADLLIIQVCSEPAPMHCSTGHGKMRSSVFNAALQNRLNTFKEKEVLQRRHICRWLESTLSRSSDDNGHSPRSLMTDFGQEQRPFLRLFMPACTSHAP